VNIEPQLIRVNLFVLMLMLMFIFFIKVGFIVMFVFSVFSCFREEGCLYLFIYYLHYDG